MSATRVLFVDDDQMLLTSMERCLGLQFDVTTALSGPDGLARIGAERPFPVIITDMRMPGMDGLAFIARAREVSKNSVFVMLTGNQDVQTAVNAVNQGQVFRFLNKPTDPSEIALTIEQAKRQHDLEAAERDLLNKTFVGAIGLLSDVMETLQPDLIGRAAQVEEYVAQIRESCRVASRWEYKIASKLSMIGFALQAGRTPDSDRAGEELNNLLSACETSSRMVNRIPRLSAVSEIIAATPTANPKLPSAAAEGDEVVAVGAALLRIAHAIEAMTQRGVDPQRFESELRRELPDIDDSLCKAAVAAYPTGQGENGVPVERDDLKPGMVLFEDVTRANGAILLKAGRRLSQAHIEKLQADATGSLESTSVMVTRLTAQSACADAELT